MSLETGGDALIVRYFLDELPADPDVDSRTSSTPSEEGAETGGMEQGPGVGQTRAPGRAALRLCNLAAQSQTDAQGGVPAGSGERADGQGQRALGADLFQGLEEPD